MKQKQTPAERPEELEDHTLSEGTGALAGAAAGAALGMAAGPIGAVVGAAAAGYIGAKAGEHIAESMDRDEYLEHFQSNFRKQPYFRVSRTWDDYGPAYSYAFERHSELSDHSFEDAEQKLATRWRDGRGASRLNWDEARGAVRDGWLQMHRVRR